MEDPAAAYRSKISDFRILRELGSGSWGTVYEAERLADCGVYALKKVQMAQRSRRDQMAAVQEAQARDQLAWEGGLGTLLRKATAADSLPPTACRRRWRRRHGMRWC